jgi:hypothetical protein
MATTIIEQQRVLGSIARGECTSVVARTLRVPSAQRDSTFKAARRSTRRTAHGVCLLRGLRLFIRSFRYTVLKTLLLLTLTLVPSRPTSADEAIKVAFEQKGVAHEEIGRPLLQDQQGGLLLLDQSGRCWSIPGTDVKSRASSDAPFTPKTGEELGRQLQAEFGPRFEIIQTDHYVLCTDAGRRFGEWTGKLFERLLTGFYTAWKESGLELHEPEFLLPVIIFAKEADYREYVKADIGPIPVDLGYYSSQTNRVVLRDLTAGLPNNKGDLSSLVNAANVTTIVHEATHQIAFNSGFHVRLADNPMWLTEGLAIYFESPDLKNASGWKTTGQVNRTRLQRFRDYSRNRRQTGSLPTLLANNDRLSKPDTAADGYAEAWLLTHFLIRQRKDQYVAYIQSLQNRKPLDFGSDEDRLKFFKAAFGEDLQKLEKEFLNYAAKLAR